MKILFLDDQKVRHDFFCKTNHKIQGVQGVCICRVDDYETHHTYTTKQAIDMLSGNKYDIISLDYDLDCTDPSKDGMVVVNFLVEQMRTGFYTDEDQPSVIIHSWNRCGAKMMENYLVDSGYRYVQLSPFYV